MTDTDVYIQRMAVSNPLIEPTVYSAIQSLQLPSGSQGLMQDAELVFRPCCSQRRWDPPDMSLALIYLLSFSFMQRKS